MLPRTTKVLLITNLFPTPADPARGIFTAQLARRLQDRCDLTVVCPLPWIPAWTARGPFERHHPLAGVPSEYDAGPVHVHSPKYAVVPRQPRLRALSMLLGIAPTVLRLHRHAPFDVINGHWLYPDGVVSTWLGRHLDVPVVLTALGSDVNVLLKHRDTNRAIVNALRQADAVTAKSAGLQRRMSEEGIPAERIGVTRNGVDLELFTIRNRDESASALGLPAGERRLVYVGKIAKIKGIGCLLEAFASLAPRHRRLALYLVGDGAERASYERFARELGVSRVHFVGARHPSQIPLWIGAADVSCLPSVHEGCPNVVLEALASGRPVVASRVGGVPELLNDVTGLMVPPGDAAALERALEQALALPWDPLNIRAQVLTCSWDRAADAYCAVYHRVIAARAIGAPAFAPALVPSGVHAVWRPRARHGTR
jgi:glycosyltransferase involved in cell wall biosynthesis